MQLASVSVELYTLTNQYLVDVVNGSGETLHFSPYDSKAQACDVAKAYANRFIRVNGSAIVDLGAGKGSRVVNKLFK